MHERIKEASYLPVVRSLKIDNLKSYHAHLLDQSNYWSLGPFLTCSLYMRRRRFWYFCRLSRESIKGGKEIEKEKVTVAMSSTPVCFYSLNSANVKWSIAPPLLFERPIGYLAGAGHLTVGGNREGIALRLMVKRRPRGTLTSEKQSSAGDQTAAHANNLVQSANNLIFFHS
ncbi:4-hydroxyproline 2-epimerase [Trichinella pseudospiralis]